MNPVTRPNPDLRTEPILSPSSQLTLTRAVIRYEPEGIRGRPGGLLEDLGLGVVLSESVDGSRNILDLGSGRRSTLVLQGPLVVLGWLFSATLQRILNEEEDREEVLRRITVPLALRVLGDAGFNAQTRSVILRLGFRDLVRDLDPHEGAAVRFLIPGGGVARLHLDYDHATVVVRSADPPVSDLLVTSIEGAFPDVGILHGSATDGSGARICRLPFRLPEDLGAARALLARIRRGSLHLLARFEPERHLALQDQLKVFGARDSLGLLAPNADPDDLPAQSPSHPKTRPPAPRGTAGASAEPRGGRRWPPAGLTGRRVH